MNMKNVSVPFIELQTFRAELENSKLLVLFDHWLSIRNSDRLPQRKNFDPLDIHKLMPMIYLCEVQDGDRYYIRTAGALTRELFGKELTGTYIDELPHQEIAQRALKSCRTIFKTKSPWLSKVVYSFKGAPNFNYTRLTLPLVNQNQEISHLIGGIELIDPSGLKRSLYTIQQEGLYHEESRVEYLAQL